MLVDWLVAVGLPSAWAGPARCALVLGLVLVGQLFVLRLRRAYEAEANIANMEPDPYQDLWA
ncbi:MAG: hypothetical protein IRY99_08385 [Isosphaeraceae bacterium]|nr:hypothetical protein [Isosphaeraceae bacterium]